MGEVVDAILKRRVPDGPDSAVRDAPASRASQNVDEEWLLPSLTMLFPNEDPMSRPQLIRSERERKFATELQNLVVARGGFAAPSVKVDLADCQWTKRKSKILARILQRKRPCLPLLLDLSNTGIPASELRRILVGSREETVSADIPRSYPVEGLILAGNGWETADAFEFAALLRDEDLLRGVDHIDISFNEGIGDEGIKCLWDAASFFVRRRGRPIRILTARRVGLSVHGMNWIVAHWSLRPDAEIPFESADMSDNEIRLGDYLEAQDCNQSKKSTTLVVSDFPLTSIEVSWHVTTRDEVSFLCSGLLLELTTCCSRRVWSPTRELELHFSDLQKAIDHTWNLEDGYRTCPSPTTIEILRFFGCAFRLDLPRPPRRKNQMGEKFQPMGRIRVLLIDTLARIVEARTFQNAYLDDVLGYLHLIQICLLWASLQPECSVVMKLIERIVVSGVSGKRPTLARSLLCDSGKGLSIPQFLLSAAHSRSRRDTPMYSCAAMIISHLNVEAKREYRIRRLLEHNNHWRSLVSLKLADSLLFDALAGKGPLCGPVPERMECIPSANEAEVEYPPADSPDLSVAPSEA